MADVCSGLEVVSLSTLPVIPLANILSYLNQKDLSRCCCVSRMFSEIGSSCCSWKIWCETVWLLDVSSESLPNKSWKHIYILEHKKWGKYGSCYTAIRRAWNQIEEFTKVHCPEIYVSLNPGLSEEELERITNRHLEGLSLPLDVQCSYQIHNGQRLVSPGLIGSMAISNHYQSESLLDLSVASSGLQHRQGLQNCLLLSLCIYTGNGQFIALTDQEGHSPGEIFWPSPDRSVIMDGSEIVVKMHKFHSACTFTDWLTEYAERLSQNYYPVINKEIFKFEYAGSATTNAITVKTATAFLPELSSVHPPLFFFTYRISISMDKYQGTVEDKCQLMTRHWYITDGNGEKTEVHGDGVVGQYPVMAPGALHEYVSCTTFQTPMGIMEGYYIFKYCSINKVNDTLRVEIPAMHFKSLPYIEADVRLNKIGRKQDEK